VFALCAVVVALFFGGQYAWRRYSARRHGGAASALVLPPQDPSAEPAAPPAPAPSSPASSDPNLAAGTPVGALTPPAADPLDLSVSTSAATRVRISADDKLVLDEELPAGATRHFAATDHFAVSAADSSAVLLELNHQVMRPLGPPGASGTMVLSKNDLRPANGGNSQP
jgi:hypothetical protein